jgi:hypothetical protein
MLLVRRLLLILLIWRLRLVWRHAVFGGALQNGLVQPLSERHSGAARGFPGGVAGVVPHTFHIPRATLSHALIQTSGEDETLKSVEPPPLNRWWRSAALVSSRRHFVRIRVNKPLKPEVGR